MTKSKIAVAAAALLASTGFAAQATAVTVNLSQTGSWNGLPGVYTVAQNFVLPTNAINTVLSITQFSVDDRGILSLNGTAVDATGIFANNGSVGAFNFVQGSPAVAYTFNAPGARTVNVTTGFVLGGNNVFRFTGNDTRNGIFGETIAVAEQTGYVYTAQVTYDLATSVPEPASWAMMILGMGAVGFAMRRRPKLGTTVTFA